MRVVIAYRIILQIVLNMCEKFQNIGIVVTGILCNYVIIIIFKKSKFI